MRKLPLALLVVLAFSPSASEGQALNLIVVNDAVVPLPGGQWQYTYQVVNQNPVPVPLTPFLILSIEQHPSHPFNDEIVTILPGGTAYTPDFLWSGGGFVPLPAFSDDNYTFIGLQLPGGMPIPAGGMVEVQFTDPHPPAPAPAALAFGNVGPLADNFREVGNVLVPHVPSIPALSTIGYGFLALLLFVLGARRLRRFTPS